MEITRRDPPVERISRFHTLQSGQYWRALRDIAEEGIDAGTVLLIQSIRWVDDSPHTIILRAHPSKIGTSGYVEVPQEDGTTSKKRIRYDEHRFLLDNFLSAFEYEPDYQRFRNEEVQRVRGKIDALQGELLEAQSNPAILAAVVETGLREEKETNKAQAEKDSPAQQPALPAPVPTSPHQLAAVTGGSLADALGTGITTESIAALKAAANREHQIATIKSKWIQGKTAAIADTIKALTPFYEEQAAAALASTEDVRSYVAKLMRGIETLDLYVGKDVDVTTIREGTPAPKDVPLTFVQKKLMMDEELAVYTDIDEWFDFTKEELFFDALRDNDALVNQIFPTERCVLVMATTRRDIDYGDVWTNNAKNTENRKVFLMIRDGMNIHRVFSSVESHLGTSRLFPSQDDQNRIFRGFDGNQIKFEDVAFTDKLAAHERFALHYKRFLILACGLDHRLKLFGDFYDGPPSFDFVSIAFQDKYCRFLHDDDGAGLLPAESRPALRDWLAEKNAYLRSGSRVMCNWSSLMDPDTAPAACFREREGFDRRYTPKERSGVAIAYRQGTSLCVDVEVSGYSYSSHGDRVFNCKVNLSKASGSRWSHSERDFLVLDAVQPDELHWYIHNRGSRRDHVSYIRFFKEALRHVQAELSAEQDTRRRMAQALADGNVAAADEADGIIHQAVIAWRAAHRGKPLPRFEGNTAPSEWKSLLDQMYMLAGEGQRRTSEIAAFVSELGYEPLRLVLSGGAKLIVYAAPSSEERDERLEPHAWVHRITVERGKTRYVEKARRWAILPKHAVSETTIHEWEGGGAWADPKPVFPSFERKHAILAEASQFLSALRPFTGATEFDRLFREWSMLRADLLRDSKYVENPSIAVPFGVMVSLYDNELDYLCIGARHAHAVLYSIAPDDEARQSVRNSFVRPYANKSSAFARFDEAVAEPFGWSLVRMSVSSAELRQGVYASTGLNFAGGQQNDDPRLAEWFTNWKKSLHDSEAKRLWIADGALNAQSRLVFDDLLNIKLPDDFEPLKVLEIELRPAVGQKAPKYLRFFDLFGADRVENERAPFGDNPHVNGFDVQGYSSITHRFSSRAKAHDFITNRVSVRADASYRVIAADDLADAPSPPDGVERWYAVQQ